MLHGVQLYSRGTGRRVLALVSVFAAALGAGYYLRRSPLENYWADRIMGNYTVGDRLGQFGAAAHGRWAPWFTAAGLTYPPRSVLLVGLKREKRLDVYAARRGGSMAFVRSMPILAASGKAGPKLREGDLQVPEGFYGIESLNPNSSYHVSLRVNYPSTFDRDMARVENRTELGSDIMIHGSNASAGCLAMGDKGAEDLFTLAADTGLENFRVVLCPLDLRHHAPPSRLRYHPAWLPDLYTKLHGTLARLPDPR